MGLLSFIQETRRDLTAHKIGLLGHDLGPEIETEMNESGKDGDRALLEATSMVEQEWLVRHNAENDKLITHTIVEAFFRYNEPEIQKLRGYMSKEDHKKLKENLRSTYQAKPLSRRPSFLDRLRAMDLAGIDIIEQATEGSVVRETFRLTYEAKIQIIEGKY